MDDWTIRLWTVAFVVLLLGLLGLGALDIATTTPDEIPPPRGPCVCECRGPR